MGFNSGFKGLVLCKEGKDVPVHAVKTYMGSGGICFTHSSPRHWMEVSSRHRSPAILPRGKNSDTHYIGGCVVLSAGMGNLEKRNKFLPLLGFYPLIVETVIGRFVEYAIPAPGYRVHFSYYLRQMLLIRSG